MAKTTCVVFGLVFLALGILGLTGLIPMFTSDPAYVNIGEIVLGGLGLLVGIYARQGSVNNQQRRQNEHQRKENEQHKNENYDQQRKVIEQQRKENDQQKKRTTSREKLMISREKRTMFSRNKINIMIKAEVKDDQAANSKEQRSVNTV